MALREVLIMKILFRLRLKFFIQTSFQARKQNFESSFEIYFHHISFDRIQNFAKYESDVPMYGTLYDYDSIMHYSANAFSNNGNKTIVAKEPGADRLMVWTLRFYIKRNLLSE